MKRYLAALLIIFALSSGLIIRAVAALETQGRDVAVTERVIMGDSASARGLRVEFCSAASGRRLLWRTVFEPGQGEPEPETDLEYRKEPEGLTLDSRWIRFGLWDMELDSGVCLDERGFAMDGGRLLDLAGGNKKLAARLRQVISRTGPGETRRETFPLGECVDALRWELSGGRDRLHIINLPDSDIDKLTRLFSVPVPEDLYMSVSVSKNSSGGIIQVYCRPAPGPEEPEVEAGLVTDTSYPEKPVFPGGETVMADVSEDGVLVFPSVRDGEGRELVECFSGPGLYLIPFMTDSELQEPNAVMAGYMPGALNVDKTALLFPTGEAPEYLHALEDGTVKLATGSGGLLTLHTIAGEKREDTPLLKSESELEKVIDKGELTLFILASGEYALTETKDGASRLLLTGVMDLALTAELPPHHAVTLGMIDEDGASLAWDGERMALADAETQFILVAGEKGVEYLGRFSAGSANCIPVSVSVEFD